jgi:hypothetical protein
MVSEMQQRQPASEPGHRLPAGDVISVAVPGGDPAVELIDSGAEALA